MAPVESLLTLGALALQAVAHPRHSVAKEAAERSQYMKRNPRSVKDCAAQLETRGHVAAAKARRAAMTNEARVKRSLITRDFADYNTSHASDKSVGLGSDVTELFSDGSSCTLQEETTQGPYYVEGELIRSNLIEDQAGIPLYLDIQLIDTASCSPAAAQYLDIWACNATGVYSGVSAGGNGNEDDTSNLNTTFARGIQLTDSNGVAQFETVFPGHYTGRATHIHLLSHTADNATVRTNRTMLEGYAQYNVSASHVGQIFFDQDLISKVEATTPYTDNEQELTLNADDGILSSEAESSDPFVEYVMLGDDISEGVMAWISIGIDPTVSDATPAAAIKYADFGESNPDQGIGMPDGGAGGPPGASGSMPPIPSSSSS